MLRPGRRRAGEFRPGLICSAWEVEDLAVLEEMLRPKDQGAQGA